MSDALPPAADANANTPYSGRHSLTKIYDDPQGYGDGLSDYYECTCGARFEYNEVNDAFEHGRVNNGLGELGLPYTEAGGVVQFLAATLVDRGYEREDVITRLREWAGSGYEGDWWERWGGPATDNLAYALGYEYAFPEEEEG